MQLKPIKDFLIVRVLKAEQTSKAGFVSQSAHKFEDTAIITAVGPEVPEDLQVGQRVLFSPMAGHPFTLDNQELRMLLPTDIFGVFDADEEASQETNQEDSQADSSR